MSGANGSAPVPTLPAPAPTAPPPAAALEVTGLSSGYGSTAVLRDVSVTVPAGGIVALLGPNGAGKTTFLRTVAGFLPARAGTIRADGRDVTATRAHHRFAAGLCLVPEGRGVFRSLTVRDNVVMQARKGREAEAIERAVAAFPVLGQRLHQRAGTMSGGEQQMLAMAAAYVREPRLLLVDEASLGLAPIVVDRIFAFLEERAAAGAALLIVDQFVHRALGMAATAYVLHRGTIAFCGPSRELLDGNLFEQYLGRGAA
jgi:branched-chain amino acid transport system ATP-binding protein